VILVAVTLISLAILGSLFRATRSHR